MEQKWEADWLSAENAKLRCVVCLQPGGRRVHHTSHRRKAFDLLKRQEQLEELLASHISGLRKQRQASPAPQEAVGAHKAGPLEPVPAVEAAPSIAQELPPLAPAPPEIVEATPVVAAEQAAVQQPVIAN